MRYDRDYRSRGPRPRGGFAGRGEYGESYQAPFPPTPFRPSGRFAPRHGWSEGFDGGALRSRGSWEAGGRGYEPGDLDEDGGEFEWGGGYVGGRGYGGTNYDLDHGYAIGGRGFPRRPPMGAPPREGESEFSSPASRGGYEWGEAAMSEDYGPARYGYGPYYERLRRRRRDDGELREEVEETLFYDTWVDADAISVRVQDGVVTLTGVLPSFDELRYAVDDAWDVEGVRGVRSELEVSEQSGRGEYGRTGRGHRSGAQRGAQSGARAGEPVADPERYAPGAPHMHGHPDAGERGDAAGAQLAAGAEKARGRSAGGGQGSRGGRSKRSRAAQDDAGADGSAGEPPAQG